jgi:hypothetical protein
MQPFCRCVKAAELDHGGKGRELLTVDGLHISDSNATEESLGVLIRSKAIASMQ